MSTVTRIHPGVTPPSNSTSGVERLRSVYWRSARDSWTTAKQVRAQGQIYLAAEILAIARQSLLIATAPNPVATLHARIREERQIAQETCFTERDLYSPPEPEVA